MFQYITLLFVVVYVSSPYSVMNRAKFINSNSFYLDTLMMKENIHVYLDISLNFEDILNILLLLCCTRFILTGYYCYICA